MNGASYVPVTSPCSQQCERPAKALAAASPIQRASRWTAVDPRRSLAALSTALATAATLASPGLSPANEAELLAAAARGVAQAQAHDEAACRRTLAPLTGRALSAWTPASRAWLEARLSCPPLAERPSVLSRAEVAALYEPLLALLALAPRPEPRLAEVAALVEGFYGLALIDQGFEADALAREQAFVRPLLAQLRQQPGEAMAEAALRTWAQRYYGARNWIDRLARWLPEVEAALGEGHPVVLQLLSASAFAHRMLGRPQEALREAGRMQALVQRHAAGDARLRASAASAYGQALAANGLYVQAISQLLTVRQFLLSQEPPPQASLMRVNYNLAGLAWATGDEEAALAYAQASISHARLQPDKRTESESLVADFVVAMVRLRRQESGAAAAARALLESLPHESIGSHDVAFELARHAQRAGDRPLLDWVQGYLGRYAKLHFEPLHADRPMLGLVDAALLPPGSPERRDRLALAMAYAFAGRSGSIEALAWFAMADEHAPDRPDAAIWLYKRGSNVLQRLRAGAAGDDPGAERAWLADYEADLRRFVGLLIDQGRLAEAQQALQVLRDEELHEYTRRSVTAYRRGGGALAMAPAERALDEALAPAVASVRAEAPAADARADADVNWQRRLQRQDAPLHAVLDAAAGRVRQLAEAPLPVSRGGEAPQADIGTTASARGLAPDERRLSFFVRSDAVDVVVQRPGRGPGQWHRARLNTTATELARQVQALRAALLQPGIDPAAEARALHDRLMLPLRPWLRGARTLRIVPDGVLRFLPFAALHDGRQFLVERHVLMLESGTGWQPASQVAAVARGRAAAPGHLLALGRTQPERDHAALPGVAAEMAALSAASRLPVRLALDAQFSADALRTGLAGRPAVVHLASHFVTHASSEQGAYLLLGDGQRLGLPDLREMPWQGVHLAVLSACDTGVPEAGSPGRHWTGLAAMLQQAGVSHVLATLWPVEDLSTAAWMGSFYRQGSPRQPLPQARWVAQAQRQWLRRHAGTALAHPHHWAGFAWISGA